MIYHIALPDDWKIAQKEGIYKPKIFDANNLIPCCDVDQLPKYINTNFRNKREIVVLRISEKLLSSAVVYHPLANGSLYPHIAQGFNIAAVVFSMTIKPNFNGIFVLPSELNTY